MEVNGNTGFFQLFYGFHVIVTPATKLVNFLLQFPDIFLVVGVTHEHAAGEANDVSIDGFRPGAFRDNGLGQSLNEAIDQFYLCQHGP